MLRIAAFELSLMRDSPDRCFARGMLPANYTWHFVIHIFSWWFFVFHAQYSYCHELHGIRIGHDNRFCRCVLFFHLSYVTVSHRTEWYGERNENGNNTDGVGDGDESKKRFFQEISVFRTISSVVARLHQMFCIRYRKMLRCQYLTVLRSRRLWRCCRPAASLPSFRRTKNRPWPWHRTMRNRRERSRGCVSLCRRQPCPAFSNVRFWRY